MKNEVQRVASLIRSNGGRFVALTGAGCSTESGIPDYRSPGTGLYNRRPNFQPLTIQKFMKNEHEKKRYWGRSVFGYRGLSHKHCNEAHMGLHRLCRRGVVPMIITQNVDGLHHLARHGGVWRGRSDELYQSPNGAVPPTVPETCADVVLDAHDEAVHEGQHGPRATNGELIELHGNIHLVRCMTCGAITSREEVQHRLEALNKPLLQKVATDTAKQRPDADYDLDEEVVEGVRLYMCPRCAPYHCHSHDGLAVADTFKKGYLRPDVVLFGESVPQPTVQRCFKALDECPLIVCFGTSLHVYSSYRFVKYVAEKLGSVSVKGQDTLSTPLQGGVAIVNRGPTRGDPLATCCVNTDSVAAFIAELENEL